MDNNKPYSDSWYDNSEPSLGGGIFKQVSKVHTYRPLKKDELVEALESMMKEPRGYSGITICNKIWRDTEPHAIVTCGDKKCEVCKEFNELLMREYGKNL